MLFPLSMRKPHNMLLAVVAFCYLCLSVLMPLQHTDHFARSTPASAQVLTANGRSTRSGLHTPQQAKTALHRQDRCVACEWQATHVSAALPAFTLILTPPQATRAITTFPRYLRLLTFPASSRAPPLA